MNHEVRSIPEMYGELEQLEHEMLMQLRACTDNANDPGVVCDTQLLATYNSLSHTLTEARTMFATAWYHGVGKGERL